MTRDETKKIIMGIQCSYPNFKPQCELSFLIDVWNDDLADYSYEEVYMALKRFKATDTSGFAPSIGQLVDAIHKNRGGSNDLSEAEAWDMVRKAIGCSTYYAQEEYDKLPDGIKKAVGSPNQLRNWAMDEDYNENVVQSNFLRIYRTECNKTKEFERLPNTLQNLITGTTQKMIKENNDYD